MWNHVSICLTSWHSMLTTRRLLIEISPSWSAKTGSLVSELLKCTICTIHWGGVKLAQWQRHQTTCWTPSTRELRPWWWMISSWTMWRGWAKVWGPSGIPNNIWVEFGRDWQDTRSETRQSTRLPLTIGWKGGTMRNRCGEMDRRQYMPLWQFERQLVGQTQRWWLSKLDLLTCQRYKRKFNVSLMLQQTSTLFKRSSKKCFSTLCTSQISLALVRSPSMPESKSWWTIRKIFQMLNNLRQARSDWSWNGLTYLQRGREPLSSRSWMPWRFTSNMMRWRMSWRMKW